MQEFSGPVNYDDPDLEQHIIEKRGGARHSEYQTIAQGVCMAMTIINGQQGCTFAVQRLCMRFGHETCTDLCSMKNLAELDHQYRCRMGQDNITLY